MVKEMEESKNINNEKIQNSYDLRKDPRYIVRQNPKGVRYIISLEKGFKKLGDLLIYLRERYYINKIDNIKSIVKKFRISESFAGQLVKKLEAIHFIEIIIKCPKCDHDVPKHVPKVCPDVDCKFQLIEEWVEYDGNESHRIKKIFTISKQAIKILEEYERFKIKKHWNNIEMGFFHRVNTIVASLEKLTSIMKKVRPGLKDFSSNDNNGIGLIRKILIRISELIEEIIMLNPEFYERNSNIRWEPFLEIGNIIKEENWESICQRVIYIAESEIQNFIESLKFVKSVNLLQE